MQLTAVGCAVVGVAVGVRVGERVGVRVGLRVGVRVGSRVGTRVGSWHGTTNVENKKNHQTHATSIVHTKVYKESPQLLRTSKLRDKMLMCNESYVMWVMGYANRDIAQCESTVECPLEQSPSHMCSCRQVVPHRLKYVWQRTKQQIFCNPFSLAVLSNARITKAKRYHGSIDLYC